MIFILPPNLFLVSLNLIMKSCLVLHLNIILALCLLFMNYFTIIPVLHDNLLIRYFYYHSNAYIYRTPRLWLFKLNKNEGR